MPCAQRARLNLTSEATAVVACILSLLSFLYSSVFVLSYHLICCSSSTHTSFAHCTNGILQPIFLRKQLHSTHCSPLYQDYQSRENIIYTIQKSYVLYGQHNSFHKHKLHVIFIFVSTAYTLYFFLFAF